MRKKLFIVPIFLMAISLAGCTPPVITNNYTLEAGDELPEEKAAYASFKNSNLENEAELDLKNVDTDSVGTYDAKITLKNKDYPFTIEVIDTKAPDGSFETTTNLVGMEGKITADLFGIECTDISEIKYGIRNVELIKSEEELKTQIIDSFSRAEAEGVEELTLKDMAGITWDKDTDSREESGFDIDSLMDEYIPEESGLYGLEIVCTDIHGNASIMNAYVIADLEAPTLTLEDKEIKVTNDFEKYMNSLNEGIRAEDNLLGDITNAVAVIGSEIIENSKTVTKMRVTYEVFDLVGNRSEGSRTFTSKAEIKTIVKNDTSAAANESYTNGYDRARAEQAFAAVNQQRTAAGLPELAWDEGMYETSCRRAAEIVNDFSHAGCPSNFGENIAENYKSISNLINAWMNSPGHKSNILNSSYTAGAMGCYYHNGTYYWVNNFRY